MAHVPFYDWLQLEGCQVGETDHFPAVGRLGGGFKDFLCSPRFGEIINFD